MIHRTSNIQTTKPVGVKQPVKSTIPTSTATKSTSKLPGGSEPTRTGINEAKASMRVGTSKMESRNTKSSAYEGQENHIYNKQPDNYSSNPSYDSKEVLKPSTASNKRVPENTSKTQHQRVPSKNIQRERTGVQDYDSRKLESRTGLKSIENNSRFNSQVDQGGYLKFQDTTKPRSQTGTRGITSTKNTQAFEADESPISQSKSTNKFNSALEERPLPTQKYGSKDPFESEMRPTKSSAQNQKLTECPEGCGRSFNEVALSKHVKICKKVFQSKRKVFDSQAARKTEEQLLIEKQSKKGSKQKTVGKFGTQQAKAEYEMPIKSNQQQQPKWKKQSEALRAGLRAARGEQLTKSEQIALRSGPHHDDLIPCDYCGRKFNEKAAAKHIPFCANKNKVDKIKATTKPTVSKPSSNQGRRY